MSSPLLAQGNTRVSRPPATKSVALTVTVRLYTNVDGLGERLVLLLLLSDPMSYSNLETRRMSPVKRR